ncbi:MAG: hypothetical protein MJ033_01010 [Victivallaceae bacterium]|nr:hypothetical protein [Victivallaceae bacterium]
MSDEMRFGAILISEKGTLGFYVSHRIVLSVSDTGILHAFSFEDFGKSRIFVRNNAAVAFPEAMLDVLNSDRVYPDSVAMISGALQMKNIATLADFEENMRTAYCAVPELFEERIAASTDDPWRKKMEEDDPKKVFNEKLKEACKEFNKRPNVLVCGYTGAGKTSLAKAILGDVVPDGAIGFGKPMTQDFAHYENEDILVWDSKGLESGQTEEEFKSTIRSFVAGKQSDPDVDKHIHLVWYAIPAPGARVTDCDLALIKGVFNRSGALKGDDVIVVITKSEYLEAHEKAEFIRILTDAGIPENRIVFTSTRGGKPGCRELVNLSWQMLPDAYKDAFLSAQQVDKEAKIKAVYDKSGNAKKIIAGAVAAASSAAGVSLPLSDAALLVPLQIGMVASLAVLYGLNKEAVKMSMMPFILKVVGVFTASSLLKIVPVLGNIINAGVAGSLTGALGVYVKKHFEKCAVAKIENRPEPEFVFDMDRFKQFYESYKNQQ